MIVAVATPAATPLSHFRNFRSGNKRTDTAEICLDFDKVPRDDVKVLTERARMSRPLSLTVVLRAYCFTGRTENMFTERTASHLPSGWASAPAPACISGAAL